MALFKEKYCAKCGKKTNMMMRTTLGDKTCVCDDCTTSIPTYIKNGLKSYNYEAFEELLEYAQYSQSRIKPEFHQTHAFKSIHLDATHGYFYINEGMLSTPLYLQIEEVDVFDLEYDPEKFKGGTFSNTVSGPVKMTLKMVNPHVDYTTELASNVKSQAVLKKGIFKDSVQYNNPKGMDEFLLAFEEAQDVFLQADTRNRFHFKKER